MTLYSACTKTGTPDHFRTPLGQVSIILNNMVNLACRRILRFATLGLYKYPEHRNTPEHPWDNPEHSGTTRLTWYAGEF